MIVTDNKHCGNADERLGSGLWSTRITKINIIIIIIIIILDPQY